MNNYQVDRVKWLGLSIFEQMGNIYSEVGRTFAAQKRGDTEASRDAAIRAFDLFDATSEGLTAIKSPKLREVLRARELFAGAFTGDDAPPLDSYFLPFALAARSQK